MIRKIHLLTLALGVLLLTVVSCKKNNVTKIKTDNSFAIALLAEDTIRIYDVLEIIDSNWRNSIFTDDNGALYYELAVDTLKNVLSGDSLLNNIEDVEIDRTANITIPPTEIPDEVNYALNLLQQGQQIPQDFTYDYAVENTVEIVDFPNIPFSIDNFTIIKAEMNGGSLTLNVNVKDINPLLRCQVTVSSPNIFDNQGELTITTYNGEEFVKDLTNQIFMPEGDSIILNASIRFFTENTITINHNTTLGELQNLVDAVESAGGQHEVNLTGVIASIKIRSVEGLVNGLSMDFRDVIDSIDFDLSKLEGDFTINTPDVNVRYINTFGFGASVVIDTLEVRNANDYDLNIINSQYDSITLTIEHSDHYNDLNISQWLVPNIDIMQGLKRFKYSGKVRFDEQGTVGIYQDSHIDIAAIMDICLGMTINELSYKDTLDMDMDSISVTNYLDQIEMKFDMNNGLPFAMVFQAYLLDEDYNLLDSLFDPTNNSIPSNYGGAPYHQTNTIVMTDEKIGNLFKANKMIYKIAVTTGGKEIVFKPTDFFSISIGLKTKTTEIDINNVL